MIRCRIDNSQVTGVSKGREGLNRGGSEYKNELMSPNIKLVESSLIHQRVSSIVENVRNHPVLKI